MFLSPLVQINVPSTSRGNPLEFESVLIWKINVDKVAVCEKSQFSWNQSGFKIRFGQFLWNQSSFKLTFDRSWCYFFLTLFQRPKTAIFWPKFTIRWVLNRTNIMNLWAKRDYLFYTSWVGSSPAALIIIVQKYF